MLPIFYDTEILRCIPDRHRENEPRMGYEYAAGWDDFAHLGIACLGAYDAETQFTHVFLTDNLTRFPELAEDREVVSFNGRAFDDLLCQANGLDVTTTCDLLVEVWRAVGAPLTYQSRERNGGYGLEALAQVNLGIGKSSSGAAAPQLWQDGQYGQVISYCLRDVELLFRLWSRRDSLVNPRDLTGPPLRLP